MTMNAAAAGQGTTDTGTQGVETSQTEQVAMAAGQSGAQGTGTETGAAGAGAGAGASGTPASGEAAGGQQATGTQAGAQAAGTEAAGAEGQGAHWSQSMPEAWREAVKGFGTPEEALQALQRGSGINPAAKPEDIDLGWPEGTQVDTAQEGRFKQECVRLGVTAEQAKALAHWQLKEVADAKAELLRTGEADLRSRWGTHFDANRQAALGALTMLDRKMEGRLAPAFAAIGAADDPVIIEALHALSTLVSEDSLGGASPSGGGTKPMSTEQFLMKEVFGGKE